MKVRLYAYMIEKFSITNTDKYSIPPLPFETIKEAVLGAEYELSLVFADSKKLHELNREYRDKDMPTDILSFPLSDSSGELFISIEESEKKAVEFGRDLDNFLQFLFIHGLFHLKGMDHGSTMEKAEMEVRKKFGI